LPDVKWAKRLILLLRAVGTSAQAELLGGTLDLLLALLFPALEI
jgi:hypothetical protein